MTPELKAPQFLSSGVAFEWTAVADAWAYRFILALDEGLNDILFERISFDHGFQMYPPGPGRYFVAVEALVEDGVEKSLSNIMVLEFSVWQ
jgi:DNA helicase HerA-like ATPase